MRNVLTFIIPVRHPANAENWQRVKQNVAETVRSVSQQDAPGWKAVIVANHGADLPDLPSGIEVKRVDFAPNPFYRKGSADRETFHEGIRLDKGRRVLAGMLHAGEMGHVMIVDDDDFVSRSLTRFVAANPQENGWYFQDGYAWEEGGKLLYRLPEFSRVCGTSHIIRADLYQIPASFADADDRYVSRFLGSHLNMDEHLRAAGTPLAPLPFMGAIYRIGHAEAHSRSSGIIRKFFIQRNLITKPVEFVSRFSRLRIKNRKIQDEFALI